MLLQLNFFHAKACFSVLFAAMFCSDGGSQPGVVCLCDVCCPATEWCYKMALSHFATMERCDPEMVATVTPGDVIPSYVPMEGTSNKPYHHPLGDVCSPKSYFLALLGIRLIRDPACGLSHTCCHQNRFDHDCTGFRQRTVMTTAPRLCL